MKKIISAILILALIGCAKPICSDVNSPNYGSDGSCVDLTSTVTGIYLGNLRDSTGTIDTSFTQTLNVTRVDDATIRIQPATGNGSANFTAKLIQQSGGYIMNVPSQSQGGATLYGYTAGSAVMGSTFVYSIVINTGNASVMEAFSGTKQ